MKTIHRGALSICFLAVSLVALLFVQPTAGQVPGGPQGQRIESFAGHPVAAGQVLVKFRGHPQPGQIARETDADRDEAVGGAGARLLHSHSHDTATLIAKLSQRPDVEYVEPDFLVQAGQIVPADPWFTSLWGLQNSGQAIGGTTGVPGADVGASLAWGTSTGARANVVAVVDTGIDYTHPDLAANVWSAPKPFTVTIGGQLITCAAGTHGFNAITKTCDPRDDNNHGTHVSGTIGAIGNNSVGVVGVNWTASIMGAKFLDATGNGYTSDAINAIEFAIQAKSQLGAGANVRVLSNSWGGGSFSQALLDEINRANANDMLFVASAGNSSANNDASPTYPASYTAPNVVSVAATDNRDYLASFSNYGPNSVHLGAPGVSILSTIPGGGYGYGSGTSMAAPHVSGAAALALSVCNLTTAGLKSALLNTVDQVLAGWTISGGRLSVDRTLQSCTTQGQSDFTLSASPGSQSLYPGGSASYSITVGSQNGSAASVALAVTGLPAGATASFSPSAPVAPATAAMTVVTPGSTPPGTYTLTVTGTSGSTVHTVPVTLVVLAPPDFSISAAPSSASVARGGTAVFTLAVTGQGGFAGQVQFTVSGLPRGATAVFAPASVTGSGSSALTVQAGTTRGTFTLTITGTSGSLQHATRVNLQVTK